MSALGGIYCYDGKCLDTRKLVSLGALLTREGSDAGREVSANKVGFTFRAFHTNRESRSEDQPYITRNRLVVLWDGRLDNREELIGILRDELRSDRPVITDVEIVAEAFYKWGDDFLAKLVGDFALSLWDPAARSLLLARDPVGTRSLYYHLNGGCVAWASDLTALTEISGVTVKVDEDYVAGFLSFGKDPGRTPFINFKAVRPGHLVSINSEGAVTERRFWRLNPDAEIRLGNDKEYEERFLELLEEAVRCRLRSDNTVMAELSGGLDSSSIVCVAHQLLARGAVQAPNLEMVSYISDECASSDERKFINHVEEHLRRHSNYIRQEDFPFLTPLPNPSRISTINPFLTNFGYQIALKELMTAKGARVRLSGVGGDELLHSVNDPAPELAELLLSLNLVALCRRLKVWGKLLREPYGRLFWSKALLPVLPLRVRAAFKNREHLHIPAWMNRDFVSRTRLRERIVSTPDIFGFRRPTGRDQSIGFLSVVNVLSLGHQAEVCEHEVSYPFLHRPLVEFLCAIPFDQLLRPGESRSLMRRSLSGILPPKILKRRGKGDPREIVAVEFGRQWPRYSRLFDDPLVARYGFVELGPVRQALDRARHGFVAEASQLVAIITLEVWLRIVEERRGLFERPRAKDVTLESFTR
jgi:asparagine synthase (glutamine-hydrolysing)